MALILACRCPLVPLGTGSMAWRDMARSGDAYKLRLKSVISNKKTFDFLCKITKIRLSLISERYLEARMDRYLMAELMRWKESRRRKPLILNGRPPSGKDLAPQGVRKDAV